jgi:hypothetical protein
MSSKKIRLAVQLLIHLFRGRCLIWPLQDAVLPILILYRRPDRVAGRSHPIDHARHSEFRNRAGRSNGRIQAAEPLSVGRGCRTDDFPLHQHNINIRSDLCKM